MKLTWLAVLLVATAFAASAADIAGTWKLRSTWPEGPGLKTVGSIILDLKVDGDTVTGIAHIGSWPGDASIVEGKVDGDRITFEATGHLTSTSGIPTCYFEARRVGDEMLLTMTMTRNPSASGVFKFKGKKQSE
jgi:hypothetical protein